MIERERCSQCFFFRPYLSGELLGWGECSSEDVFPIKFPRTSASMICSKFAKR